MTVSYSEDAESHISWNHVDGPMFCGKDGYVHWLTLLERLMFRSGLMTIKDLERKYNYDPQKG